MLAMVLTALMLISNDRSHGVLTLERCIEQVLEVDPRIREERIVLEKCRRNAAFALSDLLPSINIHIGNDFSWGRSVDMQELLIIDNRMNCTASLSSSASVSSNGIIGAILLHKEGKYSSTAAEKSLEITVTEVIEETTAAYVEALFAEQARGMRRLACENIDIRAEAARLLVEAGRKPMRELEELLVQSAAEKASLAEAEGNCRKTMWRLKHLMNLPPEEEVALLPPTEDLIVKPETVMKKMCDTGADEGLKRAEAMMESGRMRLKQAILEYLPVISVSGGVGTYYGNTGTARFTEQLLNNVNPSISLGVTIPVFDGAARARTLQNARSEMAELKVEVERQRRERAATVENDLIECENIHDCMNASAECLEAAAKAHDAGRVRFDAGEMSWTDYLSLWNNLKSAETGLLRQRFRYLLKLKEMEYKYDIKLWK